MANHSNQSSSRRVWLIVAGIIVAVVILAAFISMRKSVVPIRAVRVTRGAITSAISTNGKIEPSDNFESHAPAPTSVKKIFIKEGDHVQPGQMLVQLDDADARAQAAKAEAALKASEADLSALKKGGTQEEVLTNKAQAVKAHAELNAAQRNLEAVMRLQEKGAASPAEVQAAQNRVSAAHADVNLLNQKSTQRYSASEIARVQAQANEARASLAAANDLLRHTDIRAPRAGTVYALPVHDGQFVNSGDLIVAVANLTSMQVRAFVDEPDVAKLHAGQPVELTWDAIPGRVWTGVVSTVPTNIVSRGSRNVGEFLCTVNNQDEKLLPNVNVSVMVITAKDDNALTLPREAVHQDQSGRFVFEVIDGKLQRKAVDTSISNLTRIAVTKGVTANDVVALGTLSSQQLSEGLPVRVVEK